MTVLNQVQVVSRNAIPPVHELLEGGSLDFGELRDFRWNDQLREFMPDPGRLSVSWVRLGQGETLASRVRATQSLMIFYAGSGEIFGDLRRAVVKEDVVAVPAGCAHGFVGGPGGLHALSIEFGDGLYAVPAKPRITFTSEEQTLAGLLEYNQRRLNEFLTRGIFDLLADGTLDDEARRRTYLGCMRVWIEGNQTLLFSRQASCRDQEYRASFLGHMRESLGEALGHEARQDVKPRDSVVEAVTEWFAYQMYVLDDAEKAAILHLVVENAAMEYNRRALPVFAEYLEGDPQGALIPAGGNQFTVQLLASETPRTYARLERIVGEAWDMIGALTDRIVELTRAS